MNGIPQSQHEAELASQSMRDKVNGANSHCRLSSGSILELMDGRRIKIVHSLVYKEVPRLHGNIQTHHAPHMEDQPWMALDIKAAIELLDGYDLTEEEKTDIPALMAGYCRLIDEANLIGYGMTEEEAINSIPSNSPVLASEERGS